MPTEKKKIAPKSAARKPASAAKPAAAVKPAAAKPAATAPARRAAKPAAITAADIATRAYFIAEARHREGRPGNAEGDWIEAERQLRAEQAGARKSRATKCAE